jgi:hypothetical protein
MTMPVNKSYITRISQNSERRDEIIVTVEPDTEIIQSLEIMDLSGRVVKRIRNLVNGSMIKETSFEPGIYIIKLKINNTEIIRNIHLT